MLTDRAKKSRDRALQAADLHRIVQQKVAGRYGLFMVSGEGKMLPDGSENASGYVLDERGKVHYFELGWDVEHRRLALTEWEKVTDPEEGEDWADDPEYQDARRAAGLEPV